MDQRFARLASRIDSYRDQAIELQRRLTAVPALSPRSGGDGEARKAEVLIGYLKDVGLGDITVHSAPDPDLPQGGRPNLVVRVPGVDRSRTAWVMAHLDVVPPGDRALWASDPYEVRVDGDRIFGRGVEDNQQGLCSAVFAAKAFLDEGLTPPCDLGLLFVADEETGSDYGIGYLLEHVPGLFKPGDLIIVPDSGVPDGSQIEVAEKGILWLKFTVHGQQTHGSTPEKGINAHRGAAHLVVALEELYRRFDGKDPVFDPPVSTFEPTKKDANVPNVNTIPATDVFYYDCRVLPRYTLEEVEAEVARLVQRVEAAHRVTITVESAQRAAAAPSTAVDAPVVKLLAGGIQDVYHIAGVPMGVGGGTVAAHIRRHGFPVAVWSRLDETLHGPNEYCLLSNLLGDAKVFAHVFLHA
ncbi:MAG TPA: M20 family metallo-hydrolase [Polyangia bacterium]|jgi:succinyl-diaminopimelate desuccinylase